MRGGGSGTRKYVGEKLSCGSYGYKNIWVLGLMSISSIGVLEICILEHIGTRIYRYQNVLILGQLGTGKYGFNTIGDIWVQHNWGHMCKVTYIVD